MYYKYSTEFLLQGGKGIHAFIFRSFYRLTWGMLSQKQRSEASRPYHLPGGEVNHNSEGSILIDSLLTEIQ